jgi:hypothetical protein
MQILTHHTNQQECNWKEMLRVVKEKCNDIDRQNILAKFPHKSSLTLYKELNFSLGKMLYIECCSRKQRSGIAWLIAGIWQLKGVRRNADKGRCPICFEEEDVEHILLECKETHHTIHSLFYSATTHKQIKIFGNNRSDYEIHLAFGI